MKQLLRRIKQLRVRGLFYRMVRKGFLMRLDFRRALGKGKGYLVTNME